MDVEGPSIKQDSFIATTPDQQIRITMQPFSKTDPVSRKKRQTGAMYLVTCYDCRIFSRIQGYLSSKDLLEPVKVMLLGRLPPITAQTVKISIRLAQTLLFPLTMCWHKRIWNLTLREHLIVYTSTYFSVLGGAYCSLGKQNTNYAYKAGALAIQQIRLARKLKHPILEYKCWLYFAEDLIQLGQIEKAEKIIQEKQSALKVDKQLADITNTLNGMLASVKTKLESRKKNCKKSKYLRACKMSLFKKENGNSGVEVN
ncbi:hypothetical protein BDF20DRAFT_908957 [Mycotypha africana]|uniref:uncharacterized protein n=1 Tax=Mycotypha africana TaxID=64632 RepID=UPI002300E2C9|nr:uncharacterized protein BDF20DRAFT_908957 [Mycotypha africana]KAI8991155.1 hypothetical protein BDF20DRAFT_908957 [Mycotypha africana]